MCSKSPTTMIFSIEWMCFFVLGPLDHRYCLAQSIKSTWNIMELWRRSLVNPPLWCVDVIPWQGRQMPIWRVRQREACTESIRIFPHCFCIYFSFLIYVQWCSILLMISACFCIFFLFESLWYLCLFHPVSANFIIFYHNFLRISARFLCVCRDFGYETTVFISLCFETCGFAKD